MSSLDPKIQAELDKTIEAFAASMRKAAADFEAVGVALRLAAEQIAYPMRTVVLDKRCGAIHPGPDESIVCTFEPDHGPIRDFKWVWDHGVKGQNIHWDEPSSASAVVHAAPSSLYGVLPCCGLPVHERPINTVLTTVPGDVTCPGRPGEEGRE